MLTNLDALETSLDERIEEAPSPILQFRRPISIETEDRLQLTFAQQVYLPIRRFLDFTLALVLAAVAVPVVALAALAVRLTSRGPAFYTQVRTGKGGRPFTIYKLRSMIHKCESLTGPRWTMPGDPRITPIGWLLRFTHIDELPQLLNVLKGEMSLIGPRPERPEFVAELEQLIPDYAERHCVTPGITGLAQVQLPPDTDVESVRRKLIFDLHYIRNISFWLDVRILMATALHMLGVSFQRIRRLGVAPEPDPADEPSMDRSLVRQRAA
jgi:lipopolysaccharide/colanic/teichoic acid biosynthesis glycosyltransferase